LLFGFSKGNSDSIVTYEAEFREKGSEIPRNVVFETNRLERLHGLKVPSLFKLPSQAPKAGLTIVHRRYMVEAVRSDLMVSLLPPDLSTTFIVSLLVPLVLGFLVGLVIKSALKIGAAIAIIVLLLIFGGIITPSQIVQPLMSLFITQGPSLVSKVSQISGYLPYSSVTFLIGLAVGFFK